MTVGMVTIPSSDRAGTNQAARAFDLERRGKQRRLRFKRLPGPATNPDSKACPVIDDNGNPTNFKCPSCGVVVGIQEHELDCDWEPSNEDWREIASRDPEKIPAKCCNAYMEKFPPRFDKNLKPVGGKERRMKKFLSNCAYGGC